MPAAPASTDLREKSISVVAIRSSAGSTSSGCLRRSRTARRLSLPTRYPATVIGEKTVCRTGTSGPSWATVRRRASTCSAREGAEASAPGRRGQSGWPWIGCSSSFGERSEWFEPWKRAPKASAKQEARGWNFT